MIRADYTVHNNKWSKLWANAGQFTNLSASNTGINFPYMRYTDVLLMNAEAVNELEGPTATAQSHFVKSMHGHSMTKVLFLPILLRWLLLKKLFESRA